MSGAILIEESPLEVRLARLEDGRLIGLDIIRPGEASLVGALFQGRVRRLAPGMEAAFVDVGLAKAGFLAAGEARALAPQAPAGAGIAALVQEGQSVLVQAIRDAMGEKGIRLSARVTLAGRTLVYTPHEPGIRISRRIEGEAVRQGLAEPLAALPAEGGFILRTAAAALPPERVIEEGRRLLARWQALVAAGRQGPVPALLAAPPEPLLQRILEEGGDPAEIRVEGRHTFAGLRAQLGQAAPELLDRLHLHAGPEPLFEETGLEGAIELALARRVPLPAGGAIVIEATEALTAIDVDAGPAGAAGDAETARLATNIAAAAEIARQVRLRDIGGVIVIDFIRLREATSRARLMAALAQRFAADPAGPRIGELSPFGLVEMTRRRTGSALDQKLLESCDACAGEGRLPQAATVAAELARTLARRARRLPAGRFRVRAAPEVAALLTEAAARGALALPADFLPDPTLARTRFDIAEP